MFRTVMAVGVIGVFSVHLAVASPQQPAPPTTRDTSAAQEQNVRLDVANFCCPDYIGELRRGIAAQWQAPQGIAGTPTVKFVIERNGRIAGAEIERSSGIAAVDLNALRAVRATKLSPLPAAFDQPRLTVHLALPGAQPSNATRPAPGALGEALRNLQRYVQSKNDFPPTSDAAGSIDPGALIEFDSRGVEFGPWLRRFVAQVRRNWLVPESALAMKGRSVVRFTISKTGVIRNVTMAQSSGISQFDRAAINAVIGASPAQPLPPEYPEEEALFTLNFYYNEQPPKK